MTRYEQPELFLIMQDRRADILTPRTPDERLRDESTGAEDSWYEDNEGGDVR